MVENVVLVLGEVVGEVPVLSDAEVYLTIDCLGWA
jgi:hypothetical protein